MHKIIFIDKEYLEFQATGNASRFAIHFVKEFCINISHNEITKHDFINGLNGKEHSYYFA